MKTEPKQIARAARLVGCSYNMAKRLIKKYGYNLNSISLSVTGHLYEPNKKALLWGRKVSVKC